VDFRVYTTRFWLDEKPISGSLLVLDTQGVEYADPVWVNEKLVGVVPGTSGDRWQTELKLFVPASVLRAGENDLRFEAGNVIGFFGGFRIQNIRLEVNQVPIPTEGEGVEKMLDAETRHIGNSTVRAWSVPKPEGSSYTRFFQLPQQPTDGAVLVLRTFSVQCANPIRVNDHLIGNLPGFGEEVWTDNVQVYVPSSHLQAGANSVRIDSIGCRGTDAFDDFMIQDLRILVSQ
jgi:hypothetical protein